MTDIGYDSSFFNDNPARVRLMDLVREHAARIESDDGDCLPTAVEQKLARRAARNLGDLCREAEQSLRSPWWTAWTSLVTVKWELRR